ncbi:MAG: hypothetical protein GXO86_11680 [Chlorobi bacterium]|nr:hypothetical protein [Chlorobiota bacterium]
MINTLKNTARNSLLLFFTLSGMLGAYGQITCDISINSTLPVCPGEEYIFSAPFYENVVYEWKKDGILQEDILPDSINKVYIIISS